MGQDTCPGGKGSAVFVPDPSQTSCSTCDRDEIQRVLAKRLEGYQDPEGHCCDDGRRNCSQKFIFVDQITGPTFASPKWLVVSPYQKVLYKSG